MEKKKGKGRSSPWNPAPSPTPHPRGPASLFLLGPAARPARAPHFPSLLSGRHPGPAPSFTDNPTPQGSAPIFFPEPSPSGIRPGNKSYPDFSGFTRLRGYPSSYKTSRSTPRVFFPSTRLIRALALSFIEFGISPNFSSATRPLRSLSARDFPLGGFASFSSISRCF